MDTVVPFEETERMVRRLEGRSRNLRFSAESDIGHSIHWQIYPGREVYDWLLQYDRKSRRLRPVLGGVGAAAGFQFRTRASR
jgi:hypothetical protein